MLEVQDDGKVRYEFRGPWKDGTRGILLAPLDFIARLCALVPPP
ncbi:MAG: transposase, partial [Candidatus Sericytochromatia bacterium]|nr:transposase [Candidatus Tanganyikabacteria bacterium]